MRLIDADALYERYETTPNLSEYDFGTLMQEAPTIEPKRGEWEYDAFKGWYCTNCDWRQGAHMSLTNCQLKFCPSCGADMREVKK